MSSFLSVTLPFLGRKGLIPAFISASVPMFAYSVEPEHPNVVLIVTDDQGYGDLGINGNPYVKTPVIDRLASESVRFTNFFVSPVSAPTRSSLMTGRYSMRTGIRDTYNGGAMMASTEVTIAEMLKDVGYATGIFGKWHLGDNYPMRPCDQGFDESVVHLGGGMGQPGDITTWIRKDSSYFDPVLWHNGTREGYTGYCSDIFASEAIEFIQKNSKKPFFCYLAFNAPHTPLQVPEKYYRQYAGIDPSVLPGKDRSPVMNARNKEDARRVYAMVSNIDENIGKLLEMLDMLRLTENTIVIFMTDNGPQQPRYVAGMRGLKGSVFSGGVRVPFFIRYPAMKINPKEISGLAAHIDVLPTLASLCGARVPSGRKIDGISLVPSLKGERLNDRPLFLYWTRHNPELYNNIALIKDGYKLTGHTDYDAAPAGFGLFDLAGDPGEQNNMNKPPFGKAAEMKLFLDSMITELVYSENMINPPCIEAGTINENPVILNRNDAAGERGIWEQEEIFGYWDVLMHEGTYDLTFRFLKPVPPGRMVVETGSVINQLRNTAETDIIQMKGIRFPEIRCYFTPWYESDGTRIFPLYAEMRRVE